MKTGDACYPPRGDIMVVEDSMSDLKLLSDILTMAGHSVRPASDGELALRSVQSRLPDLILLDHKLPNMSGIEVCRLLKADPTTRDIPVIFLSAMGEVAIKVEALEAGAIDYVTKPLKPSEILARVDTHLRVHVLQRKLAARSDELTKEIEERKRVEAALEQSNQELRASSVRLAELEETERRRLARELHDQVGQTLTALGINLNMLWGELGEVCSQRVSEHLNHALEQVEQASERVRDVMMELRPSVLDDYGLAAALRWYGTHLRERFDISVDVRTGEEMPGISKDAEIALFRIAQEALHNAVKHAHADQISLVYEMVEGRARLTIRDDGGGFDLAGHRAKRGKSGWGLAIMQERAQAVGACVRVESVPGEGTRVVIEVGEVIS